jgi:glycosyltransferase involved in cell wall biosynthesis
MAKSPTMPLAKVTHLIATLRRGGAEKQLWCLATALRRQGWPQSVIAFDSGGAWESRLREAGIAVHGVPPHRIKPWRLWRLRGLLRQERPQIVMSWSSSSAIYARWACPRRRALQVFGIRGDLTIDSNTCRPARHFWLVRNALERADCAVSNSQYSLEALRRRGVRLRRSEVVRNIVAIGGRAQPGAAVDRPRIVAIGSLIPRKGYDVLLRAAAALKAAGKAFELWIVGEGPERPRLEALAAELQLGEGVRFFGEVADAQDLLAGAHVFAHPAYSEGLCNVILEAMAEGVPVVATPAGATVEFIEPERTGLLVTAGCPQSLAGALGRLLDDPALRERLGRAGLERVREDCGEDRVAQRYVEIFSGLLADRST